MCSALHSLELLDLSCCYEVDLDQYLAAVTQCTRLYTLLLDGTDRCSLAATRALVPLASTLHTLAIGCDHCIYEPRLWSDADIAPLSHLTALRTLLLHGTDNVTDDGLAALRTLTALRTVYVSRTEAMTKAGFTATLSCWHELREFKADFRRMFVPENNWRFSQELYDEWWSSVKPALPHLQHLFWSSWGNEGRPHVPLFEQH